MGYENPLLKLPEAQASSALCSESVIFRLPVLRQLILRRWWELLADNIKEGGAGWRPAAQTCQPNGTPTGPSRPSAFFTATATSRESGSPLTSMANCS